MIYKQPVAKTKPDLKVKKSSTKKVAETKTTTICANESNRLIKLMSRMPEREIKYEYFYNPATKRLEGVVGLQKVGQEYWLAYALTSKNEKNSTKQKGRSIVKTRMKHVSDSSFPGDDFCYLIPPISEEFDLHNFGEMLEELMTNRLYQTEGESLAFVLERFKGLSTKHEMKNIHVEG